MTRRAEGILIAIAILTGVTVIMAMATAWGPHEACPRQFPKIVGCALGSYENLSGGLIAAGGALFAGWLAWTAVRLQISSEERRASADRAEVEAVLADDIDRIADALAATWRVLEKLDDEPDPSAPEDPDVTAQRRDAVIWGIGEITQDSWIETVRKMVSILGWKRRREYEQLLASLEKLQHPGKYFDVVETLWDVQLASSYVQIVEPKTSTYFEDFFVRAGKAWSTGDNILIQAGLDGGA